MDALEFLKNHTKKETLIIKELVDNDIDVNELNINALGAIDGNFNDFRKQIKEWFKLIGNDEAAKKFKKKSKISYGIAFSNKLDMHYIQVENDIFVLESFEEAFDKCEELGIDFDENYVMIDGNYPIFLASKNPLEL